MSRNYVLTAGYSDLHIVSASLGCIIAGVFVPWNYTTAITKLLGSADEVTRFGDCEVDFVRGELRRAGKAVPTTPLEFKLLGLFTRRAGRVLTRRVLIDEAWGKDTAVTERVVDNQIGNLRRKIEPSPATPRFLKSVRGIGYRFDLEEVTES